MAPGENEFDALDLNDIHMVDFFFSGLAIVHTI